jgi:hypothetical protein|tara:strand:- start:312 stop:842 length:531 start_codon:yes stop_codon:yes gene_type:complete
VDTLNKQKYKYVKNMVSSEMIEFLTSWSLKNFTLGDEQVPFSSANHSKDSDIYQHITHFLLPIMERETNLKLKPIYSYNRIYLGGAELKKHVDRPACEISASITLKYFYKDENYKWPLCMGDTPIVIESGDGVIYKGCEIEHWRPFFNQPKEYWHHQLFIHYVDLKGPYKNIKEED